ncbi:MAG TPA: hypothetical protein VFS66_02050 [Acidimicrobiia bacterium]|nr:hypothetical protein [Acidimicrobiia bacterium]
MSSGEAPIPVDLDDIVRRLAEIDRLLGTENREPSQTHFQLLTERDHLRGLAQCFRSTPDHDRSSEQLHAERASLKRMLEGEKGARTGFVTAKGGGNHSPSPGAWVTLGAESLAAGQLNRMVARISAIDDELARRGS